MLPINITLSHYKRKDIQEEMINSSKDKEVVARFNDKFGKRPDTLNYPKDILELAKQGATSFHASEELWQNPLALNPELRKEEMDQMRIGWDLVLDIDCGIFEYSRIAADLTIKALQYHKIKSISCKFSGNKGFHIGVPFEAFPETIKNEKTEELFPDAAKNIALYLFHMITGPLGKRIMEMEGDISEVAKKTGKKVGEITTYKISDSDGKVKILDPKPFLNIDTILISSRHLYRTPYSLHEKSGLVSIPIDPYKVNGFEKQQAKPENVKISEFVFLDNKDTVKGEAKQLVTQAFDFTQKEEEEVKIDTKKDYEIPESALNEEFFPPCIKLILNGVGDGRKRAVFILINFLTSVGWQYDQIEKLLKEWNKKNKEHLREVYWLGQLRHHKQNRKKILPPNCANNMYMLDIGVCKKDNLCTKIKNPVSYSMRKGFYLNKEKDKRKSTK